MARDVRDTRTESAEAGASAASAGLAEVRAAITAALEADPLTPEERAARMAEGLEHLRKMHKWLLEEMGGPLPAGWGARMIREGRP